MVNPFLHHEDIQLVEYELATFLIHALQDFQLDRDRPLNPHTLSPPAMNLEGTQGY